jgi:hypothetical protein
MNPANSFAEVRLIFAASKRLCQSGTEFLYTKDNSHLQVRKNLVQVINKLVEVADNEVVWGKCSV